jgi:hypothetical protein
MTEPNNVAVRAGADRRVPGRYIVYGIVALAAVVLGFSLLLALNLTPAAERFHNPPPKVKQQ